jgi:hypothetical protein
MVKISADNVLNTKKPASKAETGAGIVLEREVLVSRIFGIKVCPAVHPSVVGTECAYITHLFEPAVKACEGGGGEQCLPKAEPLLG